MMGERKERGERREVTLKAWTLITVGTD